MKTHTGIALALCLAPLTTQAQSLPKPDAQALWSYLQKQNYQKTFRLFPAQGKLYRGTDPHGAWRQPAARRCRPARLW